MTDTERDPVIADRMERASRSVRLRASIPEQARYWSAARPRVHQRLRRRAVVATVSVCALLTLASGSVSPVQWVSSVSARIQVCSRDGLSGCVTDVINRNTPTPAVTPTPVPTPAPTIPTALGAVLLSDNFDGESVGQHPTGWVVTSRWKISQEGSNGIAAASAGGAEMTAGSTSWTDVVLTASARLDGPTSVMRLRLRHQGEGDFYSCNLSAKTLELTVSIKDHVVGHHVSLTTPLASGTWQTMEFSAVGDQLVCALPGGPSLSIHDATFSTGNVGAGTYGQASLDNVVVRAAR